MRRILLLVCVGVLVDASGSIAGPAGQSKDPVSLERMADAAGKEKTTLVGCFYFYEK